MDAPCTSGTFVKSTVTGWLLLVTVVVLLNSWQSSTWESMKILTKKAVHRIFGYSLFDCGSKVEMGPGKMFGSKFFCIACGKTIALDKVIWALFCLPSKIVAELLMWGNW